MNNGIMFPSETNYVSPFGSQAVKASVMKNVKYIPVPKEGNEDTFSRKKKMSADTKFNLKFFGGMAAAGAGLYAAIKHKGKISEFISNPKFAPVKEAAEKAGAEVSEKVGKAKKSFKSFFSKSAEKGAAEKTESRFAGKFEKVKTGFKEFVSKFTKKGAPEKAPTVVEKVAALPLAGEVITEGVTKTVTPSSVEKAAEVLSETVAGKTGELSKLPQIPREILLGKNPQPFAAEIAAQEAAKAAGILKPPALPVAEAPKKGFMNSVKTVTSKIGETISDLGKKLPKIGKKATEEGSKKTGLGTIIKDAFKNHFSFKRIK